MNRREFVISAAGLAATVGVRSVLGQSSDGPPVRIGFLGAGYSHAAEKIRLIRETPAFTLIGIAEESAPVRALYEKQGIAVLSRRELLDKCEAIIVESEVRHHARDAREALAAGKHVHLEKPPADTMTDFKEIVRLAREKKCLLQVGYMWRFNPGFARAIEAARNGWLGEVYLVRATMNTQLAGDRRPEWAEFKGGAMFEQGCHLIDAVVRLLGAPRHVVPILRKHGRFDDTLADNCVAVFAYPNATASVTNATMQPNAGPHRFLEILGTKGTATVKPIEPPSLQIDLAEAAGPYKRGQQTVELPAYRRYVDEFTEFAGAIRGQTQLSVSLDEELRVQETLLRACEMI